MGSSRFTILQVLNAGSTKERLEQLEEQKRSLKLSITQTQIERPRYTKPQIVDWISRFKYENVNDTNYQRQIIDAFINAIYVFDDKLAFTYNFHDGTETITLKAIEAAFGSDLSQVAPRSSGSKASMLPELFLLPEQESTYISALPNTLQSLMVWKMITHLSNVVITSSKI